MLDYSGFKNEFISRCREKLNECAAACADNEVCIEEQPVRKAQTGQLTGLIFRTRGSNCSPTIYVEDFFRMYESGHSVDDLSHAAMMNVIPYIKDAPGFPVDAFEDTANLRVRLLNLSRNRDYLSGVPHRDCGCGLALIAEVRSGEFRAVVTESLLESMEMTVSELLGTALENSSASDPPVLYELSELLMKGHDLCRNLLKEEPGTFIAADSLYLLSNSDCFWGSAALFYPDLLRRLNELLHGSFFVLPSSVHEVLLLPESGGDPERLAEIISNANRTVVSDDDYLSDDLYICEEGKLRKIAFNTLSSSGISDGRSASLPS